MRRRKRSSAGSLDSLLDTMTNVVGILVIVLSVTQLGVRDAVQRVSAKVGIDPEQLAEVEAKLAEAEKVRQALEFKWRLFELSGTEDPAPLKKEYEAQIELTEADIKELERARKKKIEKAEKDREAVLAAIEKQKEEVRAMQEQVASADKELAALRALLAETPDREVLGSKQVHLPDPRAAPEGSKPLVFFCRGGRLSFANVDDFRDRSQKRALGMIRLRKLDRDPAAGIDGKKLAELFNDRNTIGAKENIDVILEVPSAYPRLRLIPEDDAGEGTEQLERSTSSYRSGVQRVDNKQFYARFLVWPDSYETYLVGRRIATDAGMLAGWQPMSTGQEYYVSLQGGIRCGPPPKPKPKPPPGEKPPPPKPPEKPVPVDTID
jgi:hypothetical protein